MKDFKGGYKLISLEKVDMLSLEVGVVIKGIHERIEASYGKPLLLTGIVIDEVEKNDVYIEELKVVDGSFVFKAYGYEITVDDEDNVEAVEIHVPIVKSVTTAAAEKDIDIQDGDEYLLSSTHDGATIFNFPSECYLSFNSDVTALDIITEISTHDDCYLGVANTKEVYIKRVGNMILVSSIGLVI